MIKKILVVGGTGMLGMPVVFKLILKGYQVRIMTRNEHKASLIFGDIAEIVVGDVTRIEDIRYAMTGCDGVHINLSGDIELPGVKNIVHVAKDLGIKLVTYISGDSVNEQNTWFPMIRAKLEAENLISRSGLNFIIYRPTWFMESLPLFVRDNRAIHLGTRDVSFHFLAAEDYANIVARSYGTKEAYGKKLYIHGPEQLTFYQALSQYCQEFHPDIQVKRMPFFLAGFIAFITYSNDLKQATKMMKYFYTVGECGDPTETNDLFGPAKMTLQQWLKKRKKLSSPEFFDEIT